MRCLLVAILAVCAGCAQAKQTESIARICMDYHVENNNVSRQMIGDWALELLGPDTTYGESYAVVFQYGPYSKYLSCVVSESGTVFVESNKYSDELQRSLN